MFTTILIVVAVSLATAIVPFVACYRYYVRTEPDALEVFLRVPQGHNVEPAARSLVFRSSLVPLFAVLLAYELTLGSWTNNILMNNIAIKDFYSLSAPARSARIAKLKKIQSEAKAELELLESRQ